MDVSGTSSWVWFELFVCQLKWERYLKMGEGDMELRGVLGTERM